MVNDGGHCLGCCAMFDKLQKMYTLYQRIRCLLLIAL